jgi:hypothetical protein
MSDPRVTLNIDRLVLRGIDPTDQRSFADGLQKELARVLRDPAARSAMAESRHMPVLRLGHIPMEPGMAGARKLGGGVARAIGKRIAP